MAFFTVNTVKDYFVFKFVTVPCFVLFVAIVVTMFLSIYIPFILIFLRTSLLLSAPDYCGNLFESFSGTCLIIMS